MRFTLLILCTLLMAVTSASALSIDQCIEATRSYAIPILHGHLKNLGPTEVEKPGGWNNWTTTQFQGPGKFTSFSIVEVENERNGCWATARVSKSGGDTYIIFAEFDNRGYLTQLLSVSEAMDRRERQLAGVLEEVDTLLAGRRAGEVDDNDLLDSLRGVYRAAVNARKDIEHYIFALEEPPQGALSGTRNRK